MRVAVTGGAGFIGAHLVRRLVDDGHEVVVIDDLSTGRRENLILHHRVELRVHDVTEPYDVGCDRLYNLACPASPARYQHDPVHTTLTSVLGAWHAVQVARRTGARLLQASTSEVYGDPTEHPQTENYRGSVDPVGPRACYHEGKRCAEALLTDAAAQYGLSARIARIFNTYGPGMALDDGRVVVTFLRQALQREPLTVFGDGLQTRSLCYVDDVVDGLVALMELAPHRPGPVNLGNPDERSILALVDAVRALLPGSEVTFGTSPPDEPRRRQPDITRARDLLGFAPRVDLEEGLRRTLDDVRHRLGSGSEPTPVSG